MRDRLRGVDRLHFTGDDEADRLLASEPLALLIGFALDQQVSVQKAFSGPAELRRRIGHLDAARIAAMDPAELDAAFRERPALHRFPSAMAKRVQALCAALVEQYDSDVTLVWQGVSDGRELVARLKALPGFGAQKAQIFTALLGKQRGVTPPGWRDAMRGYSPRFLPLDASLARKPMWHALADSFAATEKT